MTPAEIHVSFFKESHPIFETPTFKLIILYGHIQAFIVVLNIDVSVSVCALRN